MKYMAYNGRKTVALRIVKAVFKAKRMLDNLEIVEQLLSFIDPLMRDDEEGEDDTEPYEFEEEQESVAKMLQLIWNEDLDLYYEILQRFKKELVQGGIKRMKYTLPSYIFNLYKFIYKVDDCLTK